MNSRVKAAFMGIATGLAMVVVLNSGSAVYDHYFGEDHDHSAAGETVYQNSVPLKPAAPQ